MAYTLAELAQHVNGRVVGDETCVVQTVATLTGAQSGSVSFLTNPAYKDQLNNTKASAVILREQDAGYCNVNAIIVDDPSNKRSDGRSILFNGTVYRTLTAAAHAIAPGINSGSVWQEI